MYMIVKVIKYVEGIIVKLWWWWVC